MTEEAEYAPVYTPRPPRVHEVKTWPTPFRALWSRVKRHEIRVDDRDYAEGDYLVQREYLTPAMRGALWHVGEFTGPALLHRVTYITKGGQFGLPANVCVMSLDELARSDHYGIGTFNDVLAPLGLYR